MRAKTVKACLSSVLLALLSPAVFAGEAAQPPAAPVVPMPPPMSQGMPYAANAAVGMWLPVPVRLAPGMPAALTWIPVVLVPMPLVAPAAVPVAETVDYGPVSETPVVELPLPQEGEAEPPQPGALFAPDRTSAAEDLLAPAPAAAPSAWRAPEVDYGPATPAPVVDMLALEKQLFEPAAPASKPVRQGKPKPEAAVKPASGQKKRMCWENGVVAPCK